MGQRMWNRVVVIPFHEIYPISFFNKFNFVNYINRNSSQIIIALKIFKIARITWDEPIEKVYDQQIK
jgi:hypothetical protein